jgi:DoxX-like family
MTTANAITLEAIRMSADTNDVSRMRLWTGRVLSGLSAAFFILDGAMKLAKPAVVVEATKQLGYPESSIVGIGVVLLACTLLYLIPRTSILGAVLLAGYLGGAVASNVRAGQPLFNIIFPVILATIAWGGLWLRDTRLQQLLPLKQA